MFMATGASALLLLLVRRSWLRPMAGKKGGSKRK